MLVRTLCLLGTLSLTAVAEAQGLSSCGTGACPAPPMAMNASGPIQPCYRFNAQAPWLHGFGSQAASYAGHTSFRPSNYQQATARRRWMQSAGLTHSNSFWARYSNPPFAGLARKRAPQLVERSLRPIEKKPQRMLQPQLVDRESNADNGDMTPIRSVLVATPVRLQEMTPQRSQRPPEVIRAIQREDSGPLFPLPR